MRRSSIGEESNDGTNAVYKSTNQIMQVQLFKCLHARIIENN